MKRILFLSLIFVCVTVAAFSATVNFQLNQNDAVRLQGIPIEDTTGTGATQYWIVALNAARDSLVWIDPATIVGGGGGGDIPFDSIAQYLNLTYIDTTGASIAVIFSDSTGKIDTAYTPLQNMFNSRVYGLDSLLTDSIINQLGRFATGGGGGGEANTASSAGSGYRLTLPKAGIDLPFKTLTAGDGITIDSSVASEVNISSTLGSSVDLTSEVTGSLPDGNIASAANWNTAFGWGDHSAEGYLSTLEGFYALVNQTMFDTTLTGTNDDLIFRDSAVASEGEMTDAISTHTSNASAHHTKTTDASELTGGTLPDARLSSANAMDAEIPAQVTFENLNTNSDVGTGATQVAQGDHNHDAAYVNESQANSVSSSMIQDDAVTEPKLAMANTPTLNYYVSWNGSAMVWADAAGGTSPWTIINDSTIGFIYGNDTLPVFYDGTQFVIGDTTAPFYADTVLSPVFCIEMQGDTICFDTAVGTSPLTDEYVVTYEADCQCLRLKVNGSGVTDHGALTGLTDDDHSQYLKESDTANMLSTYEGLLINEAGLYAALSDVTNFLQLADSADGVADGVAQFVTSNAVFDFLVSQGYLTGNQSITLSGDATGTGTTAITVVIADDSHNHTSTTISGINLANDILTFNSAALLGRLVDETGTGVAVFGTSPTFTTGITVNGGITVTGDVDGVDVSAIPSTYQTILSDNDLVSEPELEDTLDGYFIVNPYGQDIGKSINLDDLRGVVGENRLYLPFDTFTIENLSTQEGDSLVWHPDSGGVTHASGWSFVEPVYGFKHHMVFSMAPNAIDTAGTDSWKVNLQEENTQYMVSNDLVNWQYLVIGSDTLSGIIFDRHYHQIDTTGAGGMKSASYRSDPNIFPFYKQVNGIDSIIIIMTDRASFPAEDTTLFVFAQLVIDTGAGGDGLFFADTMGGVTMVLRDTVDLFSHSFYQTPDGTFDFWGVRIVNDLTGASWASRDSVEIIVLRDIATPYLTTFSGRTASTLRNPYDYYLNVLGIEPEDSLMIWNLDVKPAQTAGHLTATIATKHYLGRSEINQNEGQIFLAQSFDDGATWVYNKHGAILKPMISDSCNWSSSFFYKGWLAQQNGVYSIIAGATKAVENIEGAGADSCSNGRWYIGKSDLLPIRELHNSIMSEIRDTVKTMFLSETIALTMDSTFVNDTISLGRISADMTVVALYGSIRAGTSIAGMFYECDSDNNLSDAVRIESSTWTINSLADSLTSGFENTSLTAGNYLYWVTTAASGDVGKINVNISVLKHLNTIQ